MMFNIIKNIINIKKNVPSLKLSICNPKIEEVDHFNVL